MSRLHVLTLASLVSMFALAEGSKNLTPGSNAAAVTNAANNKAGNLLVTTDAIPTTSIYGRFMRPSSSTNWSASSRLYVYLKNGETVFYGLRNWVGTGTSATGGNGNQWTNGRGILTLNFFYDNAQTNNLRSTILDPVTPYATATWDPSDTIGTIPQGTIVNYSQAAVGPTQVYGAGGYNAHSFTNNTGADRGFWIVIPTNLATMTYSFDLWDFTVVSGSPGS